MLNSNRLFETMVDRDPVNWEILSDDDGFCYGTLHSVDREGTLFQSIVLSPRKGGLLVQAIVFFSDATARRLEAFGESAIAYLVSALNDIGAHPNELPTSSWYTKGGGEPSMCLEYHWHLSEQLTKVIGAQLICKELASIAAILERQVVDLSAILDVIVSAKPTEDAYTYFGNAVQKHLELFEIQGSA